MYRSARGSVTVINHKAINGPSDYVFAGELLADELYKPITSEGLNNKFEDLSKKIAQIEAKKENPEYENERTKL